LIVKIFIILPLTLVRTSISTEYKGIEANTVNFKVTGKLHTVIYYHFFMHLE